MRRVGQLIPYWPFLLGWFILNIVQSVSTELLHDEAYYWVYANHLAWGYFDHPPGVALIIWLGQWLPGELGVRLVTVLLSTAMLAFLFHWVAPRKHWPFFLFVGSMVLFHVGGFVAVPDIPLLAATCLFLYVFERYLASDSLRLGIALGVISAALLYSKYHGALLLFFACLPNLGLLLRRRSFWMTVVLAVVLFLPHLAWQWQNEFVTFRFHLFERGSRGFKWDFPLSYLYGQLLIYGSFVSIVILMSIRHWDRKSRFGQTLSWIVAGVFGLFLLSSFRGRVEANWTAIAFPALIYLSYHAIEAHAHLKRWMLRLAIPSIVAVLLARLLFAVDIYPESKFRETHGWESWAVAMRTASTGTIPVFRNSYQQASKYMFYTGETSFSLNEADYKGNQFDYLHDIEQRLQGRPVTVFTSNFKDSLALRYGAEIATPIEAYHRLQFEDFRSFNQLAVTLIDPPKSVQPGARITCTLEIMNERNEATEISPGDPVRISLWMRNVQSRGEQWTDLEIPEIMQFAPHQSIRHIVEIAFPRAPGAYEYRIGLRWRGTGGKNSFLYKVLVNE